MIPRLGDDPGDPFPPVDLALAEPDGLLAWGGNLAPERLLNAYRNGIFPWFSEEDPILWWSPARRCVIPTGSLHLSRRLGRELRNGPVVITADTDFRAVMEGCAHSRESTWITEAMIEAYTRLHELGHAHSFEARADGELVGGLYGVAVGRMFFGESMYSARTNASKIVLARLCAVLDSWSFPWLDCQVPNPHLFRMGAKGLSRERFLEGVAREVNKSGRKGTWTRPFQETLESLAEAGTLNP